MSASDSPAATYSAIQIVILDLIYYAYTQNGWLDRVGWVFGQPYERRRLPTSLYSPGLSYYSNFSDQDQGETVTVKSNH